MSSKPTEPRSIASQLVFLFTPAAALLLCCALGFLYFIVVRHAFEEDNEVLRDKILTLRADLENAGGPQMLQEELKKIRGGERVAYWIRVLDATGQVLAESPGMSATVPIAAFPNVAAANQSSRKPLDYRRGSRLFSLVATTVEAGGQSFTVQIAQDRSEDRRFMKELAILLGAVLLVGVFAAALIAAKVTKRGLRPLGEMAGSLRRIGPHHLDERIPVTGWPRELQPLALAFDQMLDRLEDSFTRLSQFSADIAHELRTPIANILGEAEVALTRARSPDEYREVIESSIGESKRLSAIVDNLLFLARAETTEAQIQRTRFDAREAIEKIASFYEALAEEQGVRIGCEGEAEINADPMLFGRAVNNLVENALRFTPAGGNIVIALKSRATATELCVQDSGSGISPEHLPRVFDRFYRVDTSRSSEGSGLGLSLVKSIAALHGGSVEIKSEVNKGTAVTLIFPA